MSLTEHLEELRYRVMVSLAAVAAGTVGGWFLTPRLLGYVKALGGPLIVVTPGEAFVTYLRVAFSLGLLLAGPVVAAQAWLFVVPALYPHETVLAARLAPAAAGLFGAGLAFGGLVVFPVAVRFLISQAGAGVTAALTASRTVGFLFGVAIPLGVVFEIPVAAWALARMGLLGSQPLRRLRRWAIVGAFVVAAAVTPTVDVVSQFLMAGPLVLIYEISLVTSAWGERARLAAGWGRAASAGSPHDEVST